MLKLILFNVRFISKIQIIFAIQQVLQECQDYLNYILVDDTTGEYQCVKTCKTIEGKTFASTDKKCVELCGQDSSNQLYVWQETRLAKQCAEYTDCSQLNTETNTYELIPDSVNQCINTKAYCNNTDTYYINEYDSNEKACILECDSVWYQYTTTDTDTTTSRKVCMIEETCVKAQITFNSKQLKYRKGNGETIDNYQCIDICGTESSRLVSFNYNKDGDYICTDQSECVMISGYGRLYRNQNYECVKQCDSNVVWYEDNFESICTTQERCQGDQIPSNLVKVTEDNQCVKNCTQSVNGYVIQSNYNDSLCVQYCRDQNDNDKIYKYYEIDGQRTCTTLQTCKQLDNEDIIYKTSNDLGNIQRYECTIMCENNTAWYQNSVDNACTNKYSCQITEEGYTQLISRTLDGQCVQYCRSVDQISYKDEDEDIYCQKDCKSDNSTGTITTYVYEVSEYENTCTDKTDCSQLGEQYYIIDQTNNTGCTINCNYTDDKKYIANTKCIQQCEDFGYNLSYNYQCIETCEEINKYMLDNQCIDECPEKYTMQENSCVEQSKNKTGLIIGIVVAVVVVIVIIVVSLIIVCKKKQQKSNNTNMRDNNIIDN